MWIYLCIYRDILYLVIENRKICMNMQQGDITSSLYIILHLTLAVDCFAVKDYAKGIWY